MAREVLTELDHGVLRIRMNRPDVHNALDDAMVEGLRQAIDQAESDSTVQIALLEGEGPSFCAGADLAWMRELAAAPAEENLASAERLARLFQALDRFDKPLVGRVQGAVFGGGVGLVAMCDVAVAARSSRFALSEVRLGLIPAVIAPFVLRRIGAAAARDLVLTARRFAAPEARDIGLLGRVVDDTLLDEAVQGTLADLRAGGPLAVRAAKKLLRELETTTRRGDDLARFSAQLLAKSREGSEARAGLAAFLDKSPPPWLTGDQGPRP